MMSYLNYLGFEITLIISSTFFMIGKVIELVYGIILIRSKEKLAIVWLRKTQLDLDEESSIPSRMQREFRIMQRELKNMKDEEK